MQSGWRVGNLLGIPFYIDYSWLPIALIMAFAIGPLMAVGLFGSVLAHELAHSLVAMRQGIKVNSITLFIFGGMAAIERESPSPRGALAVAIAGPALSLMLAGLLELIVFSGVLPSGSELLNSVGGLASLNLVIGLFNLLPGLPLDGGQILKALVWGITGDRQKGLSWAARSGEWLGYGLLGLGLLSLLVGEPGGIWIGLIGLFIVSNARSYSQYNRLQQMLMGLKASQVMTRNFRVLSLTMSLREFVDRYLLFEDRFLSASANPDGESRSLYEVYFAEYDGRYKGIVIPERLRTIERSQWEHQTLAALVKPMDQLESVQEGTPLPEVMAVMKQHQLRVITVLTPTGAVAGLIDKADIVAGLAQQMGFVVSDKVLNQIRERNEFPPGFPLDQLAEAGSSRQLSHDPDPASTPSSGSN